MSALPQQVQLPLNFPRFMILLDLRPDLAIKILYDLLDYLDQKYNETQSEICKFKHIVLQLIVSYRGLMQIPLVQIGNSLKKYLKNVGPNETVYERIYQVLYMLSDFDRYDLLCQIILDSTILIRLQIIFIFKQLTQDYPIIQTNILKEFDQELVKMLLDPRITRLISNLSLQNKSISNGTQFLTEFMNCFLGSFSDIFEFFLHKLNDPQKIIIILGENSLLSDLLYYLLDLNYNFIPNLKKYVNNPLGTDSLTLLFSKKNQEILDLVISNIDLFQKHLIQKYIKDYNKRIQLSNTIANLDRLYNIQNNLNQRFKISFGTNYILILEDGKLHNLNLDDKKISFMIPKLKITFNNYCENPFFVQILLMTGIYNTISFSEDFFYFLIKLYKFLVDLYSKDKNLSYNTYFIRKTLSVLKIFEVPLKSIVKQVHNKEFTEYNYRLYSFFSISWIIDCILNNKKKKQVYEICKTFLSKSEKFYEQLIPRIHQSENKEFLLQIFKLFPQEFHMLLKKKNLNYRKTRINTKFVDISNYLIQNFNLM